MLRKTRSGFTLIELLITIVVLTILVSLAVPSFLDTLDRRRVINATNALADQVQQARSVSIARNQEVSMIFRSASGTNWCFGLTDDGDCDCNETDSTSADACTVGIPDPTSVDRVMVRATSAGYPGVSLTVDSGAPLTLTFEPTRGIRTDGAAPIELLSFASPRGLQTRVSVNILGRVTTCSPSDHTLLGGISPC